MEINIGEIILEEEIEIGGLELDAVKVYPELEDLEVIPTSIEQNFKSSMYGYDNVKVKAVESETLNIKPSMEEQNYVGVYGTVNVESSAEIYEQGRNDEWSNAWDGIQQNGERTNYANAFHGWSGDYFYPKYDFKPTSCSSMFQEFGELDLAERLEQCGVKLNLTNFSAEPYMFFYKSKITRLPELDFRSCSKFNQTFRESRQLKTIDGIIFSEKSVHSSLDFYYCTELENLNIKGTIGQNGFTVGTATKLTHDSLISILNALKDYSTDTSGTIWTVTIGATNIAKLNPSTELTIATKKGWVVK